MRRTSCRWVGAALVLGLVGCNGNEGYLLSYLDASGQVRIRHSADGQSWQTGSFPSQQQFNALGTGVDASGNVYLLGGRNAEGLAFFTGVGASSWQAQEGATAGTAPAPGGTPAIAYLAPGRWLVALRTENATLALHVYDAENNRWEGGDRAPAGELTTGLVSDPQAVYADGRVLVAWLHSSGLVTLAASVGEGGVPSFSATDVRNLTGEALPPSQGEPFVSVGADDRFLLGYVGMIPVPAPGGTQQRQQVMVLASADGAEWVPHALAPNPGNAQGLRLRGIAGRSDGSVLVVKFDAASALGATRYSPDDNVWTPLASPFDPAPADQQMINLARTGRPARN